MLLCRLFANDNGTDCAYTCTFRCSLDFGPFQPCSFQNGTNTYSNDSLAAGDHSFSVYAIDSVGNVGEPITYTWNVNPWLPLGFVQNGPRTDVPVKDTVADFVLTTRILGAKCAVCSVKCSLDGAPEVPCSSAAPVKYSGLQDGEHNLVCAPVVNLCLFLSFLLLCFFLFETLASVFFFLFLFFLIFPF